MKSCFVAVLFMLLFSAARAQADGFLSFGNNSLFFPKNVTASTISLANHINQHYDSELSKITAAYRWITANIRYDKDSMLAINWSKEPDEKIAATLRRQKGVCDNFASVFSDILVKMNIPSFVVNGHCKTTANVLNQGHSWTAVRVNQQWLLCDPTWDIMYTGHPRYFLVAPEEFIETHWPFDPLWQLLPNPISYTAFVRGSTYSGKGQKSDNSADSVAAFMSLDPLLQMEAAARRMRATGVGNELQKNWYGYNQMKIAIINGEKQMSEYNAAVENLNKATALFNNFITYRNNMFSPLKSDDEIVAMLRPIKSFINTAKEKSAAIARLKENFQYDTGDLTYRLDALNKKVIEQSSFLQTYLSTAVAEREKLFYR